MGMYADSYFIPEQLYTYHVDLNAFSHMRIQLWVIKYCLCIVESAYQL
jgi:hypothetical protein